MAVDVQLDDIQSILLFGKRLNGHIAYRLAVQAGDQIRVMIHGHLPFIVVIFGAWPQQDGHLLIVRIKSNLRPSGRLLPMNYSGQSFSSKVVKTESGFFLNSFQEKSLLLR